MSFDELCRSFRVTADERERLAWHLAQFRAHKTYLELKEPKP